MLLLVTNLHEKSIIESQDKQSFDSTCTIVNLHSGVTTLHWYYNIAFVLLEKCTQFFH